MRIQKSLVAYPDNVYRTRHGYRRLWQVQWNAPNQALARVRSGDAMGAVDLFRFRSDSLFLKEPKTTVRTASSKKAHIILSSFRSNSPRSLTVAASFISSVRTFTFRSRRLCTRSDNRSETEPKRAASTVMILLSTPFSIPFSIPFSSTSWYNGVCSSTLSIMFFTIQDGISLIHSRRAVFTRFFVKKSFTTSFGCIRLASVAMHI